MKHLKYLALGLLVGCLVPYLYTLTHTTKGKIKVKLSDYDEESDTEE
jgi:hypothetical protein